MGKPRSLDAFASAVFDKVFSKLEARGVEPELAKASAKSEAQKRTETLERKRETDRVRVRAVRAAEKIGAPHDVALDQGKVAVQDLKTKRHEKSRSAKTTSEPAAQLYIRGAAAEIAKIQRIGSTTQYKEVRPGAVPPGVTMLLPDPGTELLLGYYRVCSASQADAEGYWYALMVAPNGEVIDQTVRMTSRENALASAIGRAEMPTASRLDKARANKSMFIILIPVIRTGK